MAPKDSLSLARWCNSCSWICYTNPRLSIPRDVGGDSADKSGYSDKWVFTGASGSKDGQLYR